MIQSVPLTQIGVCDSICCKFWGNFCFSKILCTSYTSIFIFYNQAEIHFAKKWIVWWKLHWSVQYLPELFRYQVNELFWKHFFQVVTLWSMHCTQCSLLKLSHNKMSYIWLSWSIQWRQLLGLSSGRNNIDHFGNICALISKCNYFYLWIFPIWDISTIYEGILTGYSDVPDPFIPMNWQIFWQFQLINTHIE